MPARKQKNPVVKLEQDAVRYTEMLLFEGSVFGGRPLATLLKMYEKDGPVHTHPKRVDSASSSMRGCAGRNERAHHCSCADSRTSEEQGKAMSYCISSSTVNVLEAWMDARDIVELCETLKDELCEANFLEHHLKEAQKVLCTRSPCTKCGTFNEIDAAFCKKCGTAIKKTSKEALRVKLQNFWWHGDGARDDLFEKIAPKVMGRAEVVFTWEGGDSHSGIIIGVSDANEAYASEGGALRAIALAIKTWISATGYVRDSKTQTKLGTLFQREQYRAILKCWNAYAKTKHEPRGTYGIELQQLQQVPFDPSVHVIKTEVDEADVKEESANEHSPRPTTTVLRDCRVDPCDLCIARANGEPCEPGCLGFRIDLANRGALIPCEVCGLSDEEVHDRVQDIYTKHPPAKKDHPSSDGCGPYCRGWDVFDVNREDRAQRFMWRLRVGR